MKHLPTLVLLAAAASAQEERVLLLAETAGPEDRIVLYDFGGNVLATSTGGTGEDWYGLAVHPSRHWVCTRFPPQPGMNVFDRSTGEEIAAFDYPGLGGPVDVAAFSDGSIAILDALGWVLHVGLDGEVQDSWTLPVFGFPDDLHVDALDHAWITDPHFLHHFDSSGNHLDQLPFVPTDLATAADGSLWYLLGSEVVHSSRTGTLLSSFTISDLTFLTTIAVAGDGTLWVAGIFDPELRRYATDGTLLGAFPIDPELYPYRLEIVRPAGPVGASYCGPANLNSTGQSGSIAAWGSDVAAVNDVTLVASALPPQQFGYFLTSQETGFVPFPGGSQGNLCLGGAIGRYAADVASTGAAGELSLALDLDATPTPNGTAAVQAGESWHWQCWFRDVNPGPTSNFSDGVTILFR